MKPIDKVTIKKSENKKQKCQRANIYRIHIQSHKKNNQDVFFNIFP